MAPTSVKYDRSAHSASPKGGSIASLLLSLGSPPAAQSMVKYDDLNIGFAMPLVLRSGSFGIAESTAKYGELNN